MRMIKEIFCTLKIDAVHNWESIPCVAELSDVRFLKHPHRHVFGVKAYKKVTHVDRDVEFIHLKRDILQYLHERYYSTVERTHILGSVSCEMLAEELINKFDLSRCEVDEDGENGAVLTKVDV